MSNNNNSNKQRPDLIFEELESGLSLREAFIEAKRCLKCANPLCRSGCPINNDIPGFISSVANGNIGTAYEILLERSNLPAVCGRVCPHELQCEASCILMKKGRGIQIGKLERFVADFTEEMKLIKYKKVSPTDNKGKIAVIGSGPAGITVAGDLARLGFYVTVFESQPEPGGVLIYGIPNFRLPRAVVRREIARLSELGVVFRTGVMVGPDITVDMLFDEGYDAIFMGTGTVLPKKLEIPGAELHQIMPALYYLQTMTLADTGQIKDNEVIIPPEAKVVVIGGGNVAIDAARTVKHRHPDASVTMTFRSSREKMAALQSEVADAIREGIVIREQMTPIKFEGEHFVERIVYNDREGKEVVIEANIVMLAIGQRPAARIVSTTTGISVDSQGFVVTKERPYGMTTRQGVFAAGDVVTGPGTVVVAMREAKKVASGIANFVEAKKLLAE